MLDHSVSGERRTMSNISRRDLTLGAAGAYAAFGLDKPIAFVDAAHAQQSVTQPFRKYKVGDIEVFSLIDGMRDVPLREGMVRNVSVEQVKTALRGAGFPDNQAPLRFIVMALKLRDRVVLIDSGTGGHPIYGEGNGRLFESMAAAGLDPKAVKTILIWSRIWSPPAASSFSSALTWSILRPTFQQIPSGNLLSTRIRKWLSKREGRSSIVRLPTNSPFRVLTG
jgi:hypothetical protein